MVEHGKYKSIKNIFKRNHDTHKIIPQIFSLPEFEYLQDCEWIWTEKLDGMNIRVILDEGVEFRGRSDAVHLPRPLMDYLQDTFDTEELHEKSRSYGEGLCLYGEGVGAGIQKGSNYGPKQFFVLFDVQTDYGWASRRDTVDLAENFCIPVVPIVFDGTVKEAVDMVGCGLKSSFGNFYAEGLVGKPSPELRCRYGSRIIAKIKHRDFYNPTQGVT